ncbi:hypothetical protein A2U01_0101473, partial [Trifolium medium]|nr:hypothetical protein [Trifolium medium]
YPFPQRKGRNRQALITIINTLPLTKMPLFRIDLLSATRF